MVVGLRACRDTGVGGTAGAPRFTHTTFRACPCWEKLVFSIGTVLDATLSQHRSKWLCLSIFLIYCAFLKSIVSGFPVITQFLYNKTWDLVNLFKPSASPSSTLGTTLQPLPGPVIHVRQCMYTFLDHTERFLCCISSLGCCNSEYCCLPSKPHVSIPQLHPSARTTPGLCDSHANRAPATRSPP